MTHEEMFQAALRRPKNYFDLSEESQWEIDKGLGILDWSGPKTEEERRQIYEHHGLPYEEK